ncbi:uncharacterized protein [Montipora foliosa]|uniref:uncharacterized protein n=1 Tax=Montipora foliosa TaxID=591990 RepID=UPI0035F1878B
MRKSSTKQSSIPSEVMWTRSDVDSIKADKPADIANLLNNYFYSVYKPPCSASVLRNFYRQTSSTYITNIFLSCTCLLQVTVLGKTSNLLPVISGVPQGSILGRLMFLIYVKDLVTVSVNSSIALFADDTKCYRPVMNIDDGRLLQEDLDRITLWCQDWRMDLNQSKCIVMSITRNVSPVMSSYILQNTPVQRTDAQKAWDLSVQGLEMELSCASSCF